MAKQQSSNKPVEEIPIGNIKAAIWKNETQSGPRFNQADGRIFTLSEHLRVQSQVT